MIFYKSMVIKLTEPTVDNICFASWTITPSSVYIAKRIFDAAGATHLYIIISILLELSEVKNY